MNLFKTLALGAVLATSSPSALAWDAEVLVALKNMRARFETLKVPEKSLSIIDTLIGQAARWLTPDERIQLAERMKQIKSSWNANFVSEAETVLSAINGQDGEPLSPFSKLETTVRWLPRSVNVKMTKGDRTNMEQLILSASKPNALKKPNTEQEIVLNNAVARLTEILSWISSTTPFISADTLHEITGLSQDLKYAGMDTKNLETFLKKLGQAQNYYVGANLGLLPAWDRKDFFALLERGDGSSLLRIANLPSSADTSAINQYTQLTTQRGKIEDGFLWEKGWIGTWASYGKTPPDMKTEWSSLVFSPKWWNNDGRIFILTPEDVNKIVRLNAVAHLTTDGWTSVSVVQWDGDKIKEITKPQNDDMGSSKVNMGALPQAWWNKGKIGFLIKTTSPQGSRLGFTLKQESSVVDPQTQVTANN